MLICTKCGRPQATASDVVRWRSRAALTEVCWMNLAGRLLPDEETADADFLRKRIADMRARVDALNCQGVALCGLIP